MKISVITPVLNGEKYIESCMLNVIDQGFLDQIEHIIYDGGSKDKTLEIVRSYAFKYPHIRLITVNGTNQSKAMNEGLKLAKGSIIATLNVDDFYSPGVFKDVIEEFKGLPEGSILVGNLQVIKENNEIDCINRPVNLNFNDIVWGRAEYPWNPSSYFYHKSLHEKAGYYDEADDYAMDLDFLLRVLPVANAVYCNRDWGNFRFLPGTKTFERKISGENVMIKQKVLDRYRSDKIPQFPKRLPGTLWGITTYFNPDRDNNRYKNYLKFRESSQRQGLKLIAVELEFFEQPFELKEEDVDILIRIRGGDRNIVWQREALLNVALQKLPADCDKVVWIDCDIIFKNENWVKETSQLLETYKVVQPFSWFVNLLEGQEDADPLKVPFGWADGKQFYGMAYRVAECGHSNIGNRFEKNGHTGFGWAFRRDFIEHLTFLDSVILQNNDNLMAFSFYGSWDQLTWPHNYYLPPETPQWIYKSWEYVRGSVYYCPGVVLHLWHGSIKSRIYNKERLEHLLGLMKASEFNFNKDLSKNKDGLWEWKQSSGGLFQEELKLFYQGHPLVGAEK